MLKINDSNNDVKYILEDEATEPRLATEQEIQDARKKKQSKKVAGTKDYPHPETIHIQAFYCVVYPVALRTHTNAKD
jgi:hypothetical protein